MSNGSSANANELPENSVSLVCSNSELSDFYRVEAPRIFGFARRQGRQPDEARDLVQETFLRFSHIFSVLPLRSREAYLRRIAANILRDRAKTATRRGYDRHIPFDDDSMGDVGLQSRLEARDILNRVDVAMLQLKPRTREVFMARRVDGLSYSEISEQTGLSFKIIEKEMARAIAHLKRTVGDE